LFVDDDYQGFDVEASKERSRQWIALGDVDRSRIGKASYWKEHVVPRLKPHQTDEETWVRSAQARKQLKLSTCQLAHLRQAGQIDFKKVGNAFVYKISDTAENPESSE